MHTHTHTYIPCTYQHVCITFPVCMRMYVCMYMGCMYVCARACMCVRAHVCITFPVCMRMYVCARACVYHFSCMYAHVCVYMHCIVCSVCIRMYVGTCILCTYPLQHTATHCNTLQHNTMLCGYMHSMYIPTYMRKGIEAVIHTCTRARTHAHAHAYMHTRTHTSILLHTCIHWT